MSEPKTIYDKIWESHLAYEGDGDCLLYIDLQLLHEVTSPQAFEGLQLANRPLWRVDANASQLLIIISQPQIDLLVLGIRNQRYKFKH